MKLITTCLVFLALCSCDPITTEPDVSPSSTFTVYDIETREKVAIVAATHLRVLSHNRAYFYMNGNLVEQFTNVIVITE